MLKIGKAAELLGITPQTLRKHAKNGDIPVTINPNTGRYYFKEEDIQEYGGFTPTTDNRLTIHYARSSNGDPKLTKSQLNALQNTHGNPDLTITDKGSGLNDKRPGLTKILKLVREGKVKEICITHPDRLTRFGYNYLLTYCQAFNTTITPLKTTQPKEPQEELLQDFMSLLASFSGKYYRLRGWRQQLDLLHDAENTIHEKQDAQDEEGDPE